MKKPSAFLRALQILKDNPDGLHPEQFYRLMWPEQWASGISCTGRRVGGGSSKGGPDNSQCAANWLLGRVNSKYPNSTYRYGNLSENRRFAGRWVITDAGCEVLAGACTKESAPAVL